MPKTAQVTAYIGVGSNLEDPLDQVRRALLELDQLPLTRCVRHSSLYRTPPVGPVAQPHYINAVARLMTDLAPEPLLDALQAMERRHFRVRRGPRWGPRTLDLDLLLYGIQGYTSERLEIPHPQLVHRAFVLLPLAEIAPQDLQVPGCGPLADLLTQVSPDGIERLPRDAARI
jgi:2-amino-4-hydroxy-6-hydroxymethyldihydropteridine diphosphokinase